MLRISLRVVCVFGLVLGGCDDAEPGSGRDLSQELSPAEASDIAAIEAVEYAEEDDLEEPTQSLPDEFSNAVDPAAFGEACMPDTTCAGAKTCSGWSGYADCDAGACVGYYGSCDTIPTRPRMYYYYY